MSAFAETRLTIVTDLIKTAWKFFELWGWYIVGTLIVLYNVGPTITEKASAAVTRVTYNAAAEKERAGRFEEERLRKIEELQAQNRIAAEKAEEARKKKETDALLRPRAELAGKDDKPSGKREYNPLMGHSSPAARVTNQLRQQRRGG